MAEDERVLTRQGRDRKAELLEHAERLFTEHGYADTRMVDIADAAGVAKGLVYWYFESKEALLQDIVVDVRDRLRIAQAAAVDGVQDPLERLYLGVRASVEFVAKHWQLYGIIQGSTTGGPAAMRESAEAHVSDTVTQIELGQRQGRIRDEDSVGMALGIQGIANNLAIGYLRGAVRPLEDAAQVAARFAIRGIASSEAIAAETIEAAEAR